MTAFGFVVRRLRWLARVPFVPQLFDAILLAWTGVWHRDRLRAMEAIEEGALGLPGVRLGVHRFGGIGFKLNGRELGHLHGNGLLDLLIGRNLARELVKAGRAEPHHLFGDSAWVSYWVKSPEDVGGAIALIERALAVSMKRAGSDVPAGIDRLAAPMQ